MSCFSAHAPPLTTSTLATMALRITSLRQAAGSGRETFSYPRAVSTSITDASFASGFRLQASGFRLQASGFRLQASGFRPTTPQTPKPNPCTSRLPACYRITKKLSTNPKPGVAHPQEMTFPRKSERARANVRRASFAARTWPRPSRQDTRAH